MEDMSSWVGGPPYLVGKGTYVAKGNYLDPPNLGLKNNFEYTSEFHYGTAGHSVSLIFTIKVKTLDCSKQNQAPTPTSAGGNPTPTPTTSIFKPKGTPTPTPEQYFTCRPDPNCVSGGSTIQLCPLVCTPK
jgi:hypothetical protein